MEAPLLDHSMGRLQSIDHGDLSRIIKLIKFGCFYDPSGQHTRGHE